MVGVKELKINVSQEVGLDPLTKDTVIERPQIYRMSPLHEAVWFGDSDTVKVLLKEEKASGNLKEALRATDRDSRSPLIYAVICRQIPIVKLLLKAGAPVNYRTTDGFTALFYAIQHNTKEVIDLLLRKEAEVNVVSKGRSSVTPLQLACAKGNVPAVAKLIGAKADVNVKYESSGEVFNPLMLTLHSEEIEASPIREAICELLVEGGVNTNIVRSDGCTPLMCAINCGMSDFVRLLLEKDEGREDKLALDKCTTALWVCMRKRNNTVMKLLLDNDAEIETGKSRSSPLHAAVVSNFPEGVKQLLDRGIPPMWIDEDGFAPIHYAACLPDTKCLELLLEKNINIEILAKRSGFTPLVIASLKGNIPAIEVLLEHKAKLETFDKKDGLTPLIATIVANQPEACKFLIKKGADIMGRRGGIGMTPLMNAIGLQRDQIRTILIEHAKEIGKTGELRKQGGGHRSKAWKKRFFVLHGTYFSYYKTAQQVNPQGIVILDNAKIEDSAKGPLALRIVTPSRTYQIKAETEEIRQDWFDALTVAVESYQPEQRPSQSFDYEGKLPTI